MRTATITNWDKTQAWTPTAVHEPESEAEIAQLVQRAAERGQPLKAIGSALSWSDIIDMPGQAIRFGRMARVLEVDRDRKTVRLQAGARLSDVNDALARHGLAFDNFGSIVLQTAAGYIGTGTHGTGGRTGILSSHIESLRLVDGTGTVHELDPGREPELFSAARVNLGCLGVVTEITFRCVDAFQLEERLELVDFDRVLADLDHYVDGCDYCKLWWLPYTGQVQVYSFRRTDKPRSRLSLSEWLDTSGVSSKAFSGLLALSRRHPAVIPRMHEVVQRLQFRPHVRVDRSDKIIRYAGTIPQHQETEYAIPRARAAEAIERTRRMVLEARYRVNFPLEIRFVAADDIPLSPACARDSCYIGAYVASLDWAPGYFADFEALMRDYDGRPHWGKTFSLDRRRLRAVYPQLDAFAELRQRCDPQGVFRNRFSARVFDERAG